MPSEKKKSFMAYHDWNDTFSKLTDQEAGKLIKHIFLFVNELESTLDDRVLDIVFQPIKNTLERDHLRYLQRCEKNKANAYERWQSDANGCERIQTDANHADSDSDTDSDSDSDSEKDKDILVSFEQFWDLYDKKVDRKKSLIAWKRLKEADRKKSLLVISDYVKSTPDPKFRKDPKSWLHNECWNNEYTPKHSASSPKVKYDYSDPNTLPVRPK